MPQQCVESVESLAGSVVEVYEHNDSHRLLLGIEGAQL
jgi:hypothetical protein